MADYNNYGPQQQPYGAQQQPYGAQQQPYGAQQQPYGQNTVYGGGYSQPQPQQELRVGPASFYDIQGIAKWSKTIAVIGVIMMVLFFAMSMVMVIKGIPGSMVQLITYLVMFAIYIYPLSKAFSYSKKFKRAAQMADSNEFTAGLSDMRSMLTYMGILTIIGVIIIALIVIMAIIAFIAVDNYISGYGGFAF